MYRNLWGRRSRTIVADTQQSKKWRSQSFNKSWTSNRIQCRNCREYPHKIWSYIVLTHLHWIGSWNSHWHDQFCFTELPVTLTGLLSCRPRHRCSPASAGRRWCRGVPRCPRDCAARRPTASRSAHLRRCSWKKVAAMLDFEGIYMTLWW